MDCEGLAQSKSSLSAGERKFGARANSSSNARRDHRNRLAVAFTRWHPRFWASTILASPPHRSPCEDSPVKTHHLLLLLSLLALVPASANSGDKGDGFVPMWNGKDLSGWVNVNCAPETFFVKDDMIITTGKPTGYLRTAKQYENF